MKCNHCQQQHPQHHTYCPNTGKSIDTILSSKMMYQTSDFCVSCGTENAKGYSNCVSCGTSTLTASTKKVRIDQFIDQGIQSLPDIKSTLKDQVNKTSLKHFFGHHLAYIKKTPMIMVPAIISVLLILLIAFTAVSGIQKNLSLLSNVFDGEIAYFFDPEMLSYFLSEELGIDVELKSIPLLAIIVMLLHNVSYGFKGNFTEGTETWISMFEQSNILFGLLFIPVFALAIGAAVYGWLAKKNGWKFWYGVGYSTIIYMLFVGITALFARYSIKAQGTDYADDLIKFNLKVSPSLFDGLVTGALLSLIIFTFIGYIVYNGKNTLTALDSEWKYFKYSMYTLAATVVGLFIHYVQGIFVLKRSIGDLADGLIGQFVINQIPEVTYYIFASYIAMFNWNLSLFGKLNIQNQDEYSLGETNSLAWFSNSSIDGYGLFDFKDYTTLLSPIILVIITIAILGGLGYLLTKYDILPLKEIAIIAAIFTIVQLVGFIFFNSHIHVVNEDETVFQLRINFAFVRSVIGSMIIAFAAIYGGSYLKTKLQK